MPLSPAVLDAYKRRAGVAVTREVRFQWFINEVSDRVSMTLQNRLQLAVQHVKDQVIRNISRPVTKRPSKITGRIVVSDRSVRGEFPKADTTQLMKTIFSVVLPGTNRGDWIGCIGTPLDYGIFLELKMDRAFLTRTLREELPVIRRVLLGPIV